jgi:hypothetical protein
MRHLPVVTFLTLAVASSAFAATGPSSSQTPYIVGLTGAVTTTSLLTVGDTPGTPGASLSGYQMVGLPDGLGLLDNENGTFTVFMNHELGSGAGGVRLHGSSGAFVSEWTIRKSDFLALNGADLIQNLSLASGTTALNRLCSADLAALTAFYNPATGLGTTDRLVLNGEEGGTSRAFAHITTGAAKGSSYHLPLLGTQSWENLLANPAAMNTTLVMGNADATGGKLYAYVGSKTAVGNDITRAGLTNGTTYAVQVQGVSSETQAGNVGITQGTSKPFSLVTSGGTGWLRPEDGAWNPSNPSQYYFVTTDSFNGKPRLWRLNYEDVSNPTAGGTVDLVVDGASFGAQMFDNLTITKDGHLFIQEDPGGQNYLARIWMYDLNANTFQAIATHDAARFAPGGANFLTVDEESSGIIDASDILGPGWLLLDVQAHYGTTSALVEGGQLLAMHVDYASLGAGAPVPEPASLTLLAAAALGLLRRRRR